MPLLISFCLHFFYCWVTQFYIVDEPTWYTEVQSLSWMGVSVDGNSAHPFPPPVHRVRLCEVVSKHTRLSARLRLIL